MAVRKITMRSREREAFRDAARTLGCWLLVRETNGASLEYIDSPRHAPKPIDCKPKTADRDPAGSALRTAGLVVVPGLHADVFEERKRTKAFELWGKFLLAQGVVGAVRHGDERERAIAESRLLEARQGDYTVDLDPSSVHWGCLRFRGRWIHGDFDLKDIIPVGQERRNLALVGTLRDQPHMRGPLFYEVQEFINSRLGKEMIQHGGEAQYADHSDDLIDVFAPDGTHDQLTSRAETSAFYERLQREVIDTSLPPRAVDGPALTRAQLRAQLRVLPGGRA